MGTKRPHPPDKSSFNKKKKTFVARQINAQSTEKAYKNGVLDVPSFIRAREYEIRALDEAMTRSKNAQSQLSHQDLPRSMRRRAASHNYKRMPKRLQARAIQEVISSNGTFDQKKASRKIKRVPRVKLAIARRLRQREKAAIEKPLVVDELSSKIASNRPRPVGKYKKRQKEKIWLPTHIWHAKRAKMETKWGVLYCREAKQQMLPNNPSNRAK